MKRRRRPLGLALVNTLCWGLPRVGVPSLKEERLLEAARQSTDLEDLGGDWFREPLRVLLEAYEADPGLTFVGRAIARGMLLERLQNRLLIRAALARQPGIARRPVERPIFVVGLPRTGTSLLYNLLVQDPRRRPLMLWESMYPAPGPNAERNGGQRIHRAERFVRRLNRALPDLASVHEFVATGPDECLGLLFNTFVTPFFRGRIAGYRQWLDGVDQEVLEASYREYRSQLQIIQHGEDVRPWILKCPSHMFGLGALLREFPDALVVRTHRDLMKAVPSLCSLSALLDGLSYRRVDRHEVGRRTLGIVEQLLRGGVEEVPPEAAARIADIRYQDLVGSPIETVARIYGRLGEGLDADHRKRLELFLMSNPQHKRGVHSYSAAEFGLDRVLLRERFGSYSERFEIPEESGG